MLERGVGKLLKETVDDGDVLSLFRPQYGKIYHRSNVRAHLFASVGYYLSSSLQE
jgi:hypothetical protein